MKLTGYNKLETMDNLEKWSFDTDNRTLNGSIPIISTTPEVERCVGYVDKKEDAELIVKINDLVDGCYIATRLLKRIVESGKINASEIEPIVWMIEKTIKDFTP